MHEFSSVMHGTFFVAELSGNHNNSKKRAEDLIRAAADAGADAVKLQTYKPSCLTVRGAYRIQEKGSLWYGRELYELFEEASLPWDWHKDMFLLANSLGMACFSTPFSIEGVDFLESLGNPIYKIASMEINHFPLLKAIADTGKPVILSTGGATISEIMEAVQALRAGHCSDLTILKCTSAYPADPKEINLMTMKHMAEMFGCKVGLSDHTLGIGVAVAAAALGASCIEKHLTISRSDGGIDSAFSMEPHEFKLMVEESKRAQEAIGRVYYGVEEKEKLVSAGKRSIYASRDISTGEEFGVDNISVVRPGDGLSPRYFTDIMGMKSPRNIKRGTAITMHDLLGKV